MSTSIHSVFHVPGMIKRIVLVLLASILLAVDLNTFVHAGNLFPGGFTGLSLLIQRIGLEFLNIKIPFSVLYLFFNLVPAYISFRYIGKRFTLYSCLMIVVSSFLTDLIPGFHVTDDILLSAIFGGLLNGLAISLCLLADATSGGTDFIAIFLSEKTGKDAWNLIFAGNCVVLVAAGILFGWDKALYSIIFQFASTQILNYLYRRYQKTTILIISDKPDDIYQIIKNKTNHDATLFKGIGCYENVERTMVYTVVAGDDVNLLISEIKRVEPTAFINVLQTKQILGKFFRKPNR